MFQLGNIFAKERISREAAQHQSERSCVRSNARRRSRAGASAVGISPPRAKPRVFPSATSGDATPVWSLLSGLVQGNRSSGGRKNLYLILLRTWGVVSKKHFSEISLSDTANKNWTLWVHVVGGLLKNIKKPWFKMEQWYVQVESKFLMKSSAFWIGVDAWLSDHVIAPPVQSGGGSRKQGQLADCLVMSFLLFWYDCVIKSRASADQLKNN